MSHARSSQLAEPLAGLGGALGSAPGHPRTQLKDWDSHAKASRHTKHTGKHGPEGGVMAAQPLPGWDMGAWEPTRYPRGAGTRQSPGSPKGLSDQPSQRPLHTGPPSPSFPRATRAKGS
ncbi:diamine acetyltransferase 2-like [Platysternon megacephalum]|uniref:Diamine acetyltransferase 2-like n=1 Tax=Platysternon megacephalum TaxID=55544 RepID=A0A4D9DS23_9SAUR|nr:diamine acetyltransferase 2-like [Platysternon megacephalum]